MTHILPQHPDLNMAHSSLQSALQIDPNQAPPPPPPQQASASDLQPAAPNTSGRKRKKADANGDEPSHPAEPRRLRRSHEACARCRQKKIKCDSKHPKCTACATAGVPCHQEDRHRQTLIARGHTERIERQLLQCAALLKRYIPNFAMENIEEICASQNIEVDSSEASVSANFQFAQNLSPGPSNSRGYPLRSEGPSAAQPEGTPPRGYPYPPPPQHMMPPPGYGAPMPMPYGPGPYPPPPHMAIQGHPPPGYSPHSYPVFQHPLPPPPPMQSRPSPAHDVGSAEPLPHDLSNPQALAKAFGVSAAIVGDLKLGPHVSETEDLAVGSNGLTSRRDRDITESFQPRDAAQWVSVSIRRNSITSSSSQHSQSPASPANKEVNAVAVWLPKDRAMVRKIVEVYFARLNYHRPVFMRHSFEQKLDALYDGQTVQHDPGFLCSVYLLLALGTLSELNHRVSTMEKDGNASPSSKTPRKLMPADWPEHEEFFNRALAVKPDLRVTVSSLQALILLQWYLYTERQGRALWRLVGSLVRLAIELGLHHDPNGTAEQPSNLSEEECQLRIRLWGIVLLHDRGTSILLGRPLGIAPSDSNTPRPIRGQGSDISEHFVLSAPIAEIQADIINSLYAPKTHTAEGIMRHANRILKSMVEFRRQLPDSYKWYFSGTEDWPVERRIKLVQDITADQGLTLLKIGITRILLLRALFSSKELPYNQRHRALIDAIVTSHNIIIVHNQLIRFPDIAFFVSPIPLHIAAMVILFGHMSKCDRLDRDIALEDVWMALDMLPSFRWRWERKEHNRGHPLIAKLAEEVLKVNLHQVAPTNPPMLLSEHDWDTEGVISPRSNNGSLQQSGPQPTTPIMGPAQYSPRVYGNHQAQSSSMAKGNSPGKNGMSGAGSDTTAADKKLAEVPAGLFYPYYPENQTVAANGAAPTANGPDINRFFAAAAGQPMGAYGYQPQESYMLEEKEPPMAPSDMRMWMNGNNQGEQRPMGNFPMAPQQS